MNDRIQKGYEHGVEWIIDSTKYDPIIISVKSDKGEETVEHKCEYQPVFGYDASDIEIVNKKLDVLINKYATDGYAEKE